ncbi:PTS sugar transporter [Oceanobacillus piezotolerans]|uniref:PTS sugar transporter n=1 Tax=Oceanobacillus piezotolerans TaxID=2448030 RepID=A0A498D7F4_9BACI|nr:PTS sugar transporter [Oceanobacillus piezotolerans]RLL43718.1 PTS sugar transporter [Oceanobacillus piezotolerans]
MRKIAIIGSSGGNLFNLGGRNPDKLLQEILTQSEAAGTEIAAIQFIAAESSMDAAKNTTNAAMYYANEMGQPVKTNTSSLSQINEAAKSEDMKLAERIRKGEVEALIVMSADPSGANKETIAAAIEKQIPIVGTGGTSMATISSKGANVIAQSGTTGTTNRTRAISFMTSLAKHWGMKYKPVIGTVSEQASPQEKSIWKNINLRGIMVSALPGFIAMAIVLALSKIPALSGLQSVFDIIVQALPIIIAVIAAKQVSNLEEVSIVAGVVAGVLSVNGGIIGGIIGGILAGLLVQFFFYKTIQWKFPMTTVNIVAGGLAGLISGMAVYYLFAPIALYIGDGIKLAIEATIDFNPVLAGLLGGLLIWPAILGGVYHAAILPIVLLEMEKTGASFLGAIDMVGLVLVSAGINLANIVSPRDKGEAAAATPGFLVNMGFGTFVEAAYPFMFSNKMVFAGAIISAGVGGALVGLFDVRGTAYLPTFAAPFLSNNALGFVIAMLASLILSFVITLLANRMSKSGVKE